MESMVIDISLIFLTATGMIIAIIKNRGIEDWPHRLAPRSVRSFPTPSVNWCLGGSFSWHRVCLS